MLYIAICVDKPNHLELRMRTRERHLEYMASLGEALKFGGRIMSGPDDTPSGSVLFIEADSKEAVEAILENDPYREVGLFEHSAIEPFHAGLGTWLPKDGL